MADETIARDQIARDQIAETLSRLSQLFNDNPNEVAHFVTGPTRIDEHGSDQVSALGVVIAPELLESGAGQWVLLQQFNTPETLYYATRKMVGTPGLQRTMWAGQAIYVGNQAIKLLVTLQREVDETESHRARCEAVMDSVVEQSPANVPIKYSPRQMDPADKPRLEHYIDEFCTIDPFRRTPSGSFSSDYNLRTDAFGYPPFGGVRNQLMLAIIAQIAEERGLEGCGVQPGSHIHFVLGFVPNVFLRPTTSRQRVVSSRGILLPNAGTVDGTIYEFLSESSPKSRTTQEIIMAVKDRHVCEETSIRNRCSQLCASGVISKAPWGQGYFVPELVE